jgi:hypothetical protein
VANLPTIENLTNSANNDDDILSKLRKIFPEKKDDKINKSFLAYKLMRYVLATNRSSIRRLRPEE